MVDNNQKDIEQWMKDVANKVPPKKKMIYDKKKKMFFPVELDDPRVGADEVIQFIPEDAIRFG